MFAAVCGGSAFGFSSAMLFLRALLYRKHRIHLFRQRPLIAANRGLVPQSVVCGNASNYFEIIYSRKGNHTFPQRNYICRILTAYAERVNARDYNFESEIKYRAQRENRRPAA